MLHVNNEIYLQISYIIILRIKIIVKSLIKISGDEVELTLDIVD